MDQWIKRSILAAAAVAFVLVIFPLEAALEIGGDDGFELTKAYFYAHAPESASHMWNDQPWAYTLFLGTLFRAFGEHAAIARIMSIASFVIIILCLKKLSTGRFRKLEIILLAIFLITFDENPYLIFSAMVEPPCAAFALLAIATLALDRLGRWRWFLSGCLFAVCLNIKLTGVLYAPALSLFVLFSARTGLSSAKRVFLWLSGFLCLMAGIVAVSPQFNLSLLLGSHAAIDMYLRYHPAEAPSFHLTYLFVNPAMMAAALLGLRQWWRKPKDPLLLFCVVTFCSVLTFAIFQRPFWRFYMLHFSVALGGLAASGAAAFCRDAVTLMRADGNIIAQKTGFSPAFYASAVAALLIGFAAPHSITQFNSIANLERFDNDPVSLTMRQKANASMRLFSQAGSYSFFGRVLIPPQWTVIPLKRKWLDQEFDRNTCKEVAREKPELLVLRKDRELQSTNWVRLAKEQYTLVAQNDMVELWAVNSLKSEAIGEENRMKSFGL